MRVGESSGCLCQREGESGIKLETSHWLKQNLKRPSSQSCLKVAGSQGGKSNKAAGAGSCLKIHTKQAALTWFRLWNGNQRTPPHTSSCPSHSSCPPSTLPNQTEFPVNTGFHQSTNTGGCFQHPGCVTQVATDVQ